MNLRSAIVAMMAGIGLRHAAHFFAQRTVGHTGRASVKHGRLHSNQRQKRKDRRRRHAAGDKKAFT